MIQRPGESRLAPAAPTVAAPARRAPALVQRAALARWLLATSIGVTWLALAVSVALALWVNDGQFVYTLDDPYIHLAMARNLVQWGSYGVEPGIYSSASSSPAWTLLLAALTAVLPPAVVALMPLLLNAVAGTGLLVVLVRAVARGWPAATTRWQAVCAVVVAAVLPFVLYLPGLAFIGMEHTPHLLLALAFVLVMAEGGDSRRRFPVLLVLAALLPLVRLEGLLLVGLAAGWLLIQRQWRRALLLGGAALAPVVLLAVVNIVHGEYGLPNSVLAKATIMPETGEAGFRYLARAARAYLQRWSAGLGYDGGLLALAIVTLATAAVQVGQGVLHRRVGLVVGLFLGTLLAHAALASMGWFERYQAYLIALGVLALLLLAGPSLLRPRPLTRQGAALLLAVGLALPLLFHRQFYDQALAWKGSNNIYHQQYQMGLFLSAAYPAEVVAANDIGAISYLRAGPLLDLYGLASIDVLRLRRAGRYDGATLDQLARARGIRVAIIYDSFFPVGAQGSVGSRPAHWRRVATWELGGIKVTPSNRVVSFYAIGDAAAVEHVRQALRAFEPRLPPGVRVRYEA
jgi:hypothetical protein